MILPEPPLLLITDRTLARRPLGEVIAAALYGGCRWIMVREKDLADDALSALVTEVQTLAQPYHALISVNGNADVAADCGTQGIHLPQGYAIALARQRIGSSGLIGVSAHNLTEAQAAAAGGADYVTLSPIFPTISKPGYGPALGRDQLQQIVQILPIPVVALGGITPETIADCRHAGAAGVAVLGSIMEAAAPDQIVQQLLRGWENRV